MTGFPHPPRLLRHLPPRSRVIARLHPLLKSQARHIPFGLQRRVMEHMMREGFRDAINEGEFDFLKGRWLGIEIRDLGLQWHITQGSRGPVMIAGEVDADVRISGNLRDFVALANQEEDPDTLFFQRRLMISGNTDLGLQVKNLMFGTELQGASRLLSRLLQQLLRFSPSQMDR